MKKILNIILLVFLLLLSGCNKNTTTTNKENDPNYEGLKIEFNINDTLEYVNDKNCRVIILYGQSNATGVSICSELQRKDSDKYNEYVSGFDNVKINYCIENNLGFSNNTFIKLDLLHTNYGTSYGPEMGIGERYSKAYPDDDIFIIKYSWGGSCLDNQWLKNYNRYYMYEAAMNFTKASLDYLISKGYCINIEGICWMQGETDAVFDNTTPRYLENTKKFVGYLRDDLKGYQETIKFVDAYIEDIGLWKNYIQVNSQKDSFKALSNNNYLVDTISLGLRTDEEPLNNVDIAHYDSLSMVILGNEFAKLLIGE